MHHKLRRMNKSELDSVIEYLVFIFDETSVESLDEIIKQVKIRLALKASDAMQKTQTTVEAA